MGKAIIVIFFLIGFIIFVFLRAAGTGLKMAYKAVNEPDSGALRPFPKLAKAPENSETDTEAMIRSVVADQGVQAMISSLKMQGMLVGQQEGKWDDDDFIVGYVAGYVDGFLQSKNVDLNTTEGFHISLFTFVALFGEEGANLLGALIANEGNQPNSLENGRQRGGSDIFAFLRESKEPMGLADYIYPEDSQI